MDSRLRRWRAVSLNSSRAKYWPHVQTQPAVRSASHWPSANAPGCPDTCDAALLHGPCMSTVPKGQLQLGPTLLQSEFEIKTGVRWSQLGRQGGGDGGFRLAHVESVRASLRDPQTISRRINVFIDQFGQTPHRRKR